MIKTIYTPLLVLLTMFSFQLDAQTIKGEILDNTNNEALIGATVLIKDTTKGTTTDYDGSFEMKVPQLPVTVTVSYIGYEAKDFVIDSEEKQVLKLGEDAVNLVEVEVVGQGVTDKVKAAPLTVESLDIKAIKETPAENFYDGLGALKGVDLTAASLGFKVINTRGFNSTSPVRSLQIIDGVDNQAPGLNFSLGNFLGASDLDVMKVDIIVGASSAFYGPNAFNGVISMETKNPFFHRGLAASVKVGERNMANLALRYGDAIKNKEGHDFMAYKLNFFTLRADDWVADNYDAVDGTFNPTNTPSGYDAVNVYGDEYYGGLDYSEAAPWQFPGMGLIHRKGYTESDLVDYDTRNTKANVALHFRTKPSAEFESPEFIVSSSFGTGTTVYQGDNRFSLKNILFFQNRLEFRKKDKYFIRAYATNEDAGDSYDPYFTALKLLDASKTNEKWANDYTDFWLANNSSQINELGFPQLQLDTFPFFFDYDALDQWNIEHEDDLRRLHNDAQAWANSENIQFESADYYEPGTQRFDDLFNSIISRKSNEEENGTLFYDKSSLYHVHGEYTMTPSFLDKWIVGANGRLYTPVSEGTIFSDTMGTTITNSEFGAYTGIQHEILDKKVKLNATLRVDKNQNFNMVATPAASVVWKPKPNNFLRASFSSAVRNPTLTDQYLFLNVGRAILAGNLNGVKDLITVESFNEYRQNNQNPMLLDSFDIAGIQPEKVKTFEVGYRTTLFNALYVDAGYYYSIYDDFIGYNIGLEIETSETTGLLQDLQAYRYSANSTNTVTTQGFSIGMNYYFAKYFQVAGNYSWNRLNTQIDDPIVPAFNTPEHKYNLSISARDMTIPLGAKSIKNIGFNINYKWIQGFLFEGSPQFTGLIPDYDLLDAQVNYTVPNWHTTFKLGASNLLNNLQFQTYGGPEIGRLAYFSILYDFKKKNI